jgi:OmpA-OmpF porin, OOP family
MNNSLRLQGRDSRLTSLRVLTLAAMAVAGTLTAGAAQAQDSYWLFGLGGGQTRGVFDDVALSNTNIGPAPVGGFTNYSIATDRRDAGYKVFFGRQFNRYLGMEVGYFNLGKYGFQNSVLPTGVLSGEIRAQGANADLVLTLPLSENFSLLGRAGAMYTRTRSQYAGTGAVTAPRANPSERATTPKFGLGLQYAFSDSFMMRGEAEEYRVDDASNGRGKVRMYSVSLVFPFGRSAAPAPRAAYVAPAPVYTPAPAPMPEPVVVAAPAPAPVVVVVAPPPPAPVVVPLRRVSYSAESIFGFDAATVQPAGRAALDSFASELAGTQFDTVTVEGHTDRLGSTAYNEKLSMQRAEAVKQYLSQTGRVDGAKIKTVGVGESSPVTKAADCKGNTANAKLIACLQPDRRVELEVSGTR